MTDTTVKVTTAKKTRTTVAADESVLEAGRRVLRDEASALEQLAAGLGSDFTTAVEMLFDCRGRVVLTGVGKSGLVARKIAATLASTGTPSMFVHATEASHGDLGMITGDDVIIALSRSGETRELSDIVSYSRRFDIGLIAVTATADSTLGRLADICLNIPDVPEATAEISAPTTSTTLQVALGDALAVALLERRDFRADHFRIFHPGGKLGSQLLTASDLMHSEAEVPILAAGSMMSAAILMMSEKRFGCVGIVDDGGRLMGIITDGDLRRHMEGLLDLRVEDVMTLEPRCIDPHMLAGEALKVMTDGARKVTVLFVVDDERRPVGILHIHDVLRAGVA